MRECFKENQKKTLKTFLVFVVFSLPLHRNFTTNMDVKEHIIKEASKILFDVGPSAMTMDAVSRACGISKRTLYEKFPDKRALINECLAVTHENNNHELNEIFKNAPNCYEALFRTYRKMREYMGSGAAKRMEEVARTYPDLFETHKQKEALVIEQLSKLLQKAQDEGHVVKSINTTIASFLFLSTIRNINDNDRINEYNLNRIEVFDGAFINFMRGIATISGIEYIENNLKKYENNNLLQ